MAAWSWGRLAGIGSHEQRKENERKQNPKYEKNKRRNELCYVVVLSVYVRADGCLSCGLLAGIGSQEQQKEYETKCNWVRVGVRKNAVTIFFLLLLLLSTCLN